MSHGNDAWGYRECGGRFGKHYHVTCCGEDIIGGLCKTEEEAARKADLLNSGAGTDDVLKPWDKLIGKAP